MPGRVDLKAFTACSSGDGRPRPQLEVAGRRDPRGPRPPAAVAGPAGHREPLAVCPSRRILVHDGREGRKEGWAMRWCEGRAATAQEGECREEVEMAGRRDGGGAYRLACCGIAKGPPEVFYEKYE